MPIDDTFLWAREIETSIGYTIRAHTYHVISEENSRRLHDKKTPYAVHPIWCAMTLLTETKLLEETRRLGYQVLLWHDILEDTSLPLPNLADQEVLDCVQNMIFESFDEEIVELWNKSDTIKLFKLYDKVSNLLDGAWMKDDKWNKYVDHTIKLTEEMSSKFGDLNIIKISRVVCIHR